MKITFKNKYDFVCGIGHYCGTATYLKRHFLRRASGPFDWIGESPAGLLKSAELIATDFRDFMLRDNLVLLDHPAGEHDDMKNDYYRDEGTGILLYHDFPAGKSLDETYAQVRAKYDRRIARFYELARAGATLLIFQTYTTKPSNEEMKSALAMLRGKLGPKVDLLVLQNDSTRGKLEFEEIESGLYSVRGHFHRPDIHWLIGDYPQLDKIYGSIPCRGKFSRRIGKLVAKIITSLHFSKEARRAARARLRGGAS